MKKLRGFTIIEIIAVLSIIGIVTIAFIPSINHYLPSVQLNGATRSLVSDLREIQERAITEQDRFSIKFSALNSPASYQLIHLQDSSEEVIREENLPASINLELNGIIDNQIVFSPDGGPSSAGDITITISNKSKVIIVSPAGFIKIQ